MAEWLIQSETLTDIADAVRAKTGKSEEMLVSEIADEIDGIQSGYTVDDIATKAISGKISGQATSIGDYAFYGQTGITEVDFPNATSIGASAFWQNEALTKINAPNVTSIGDYVFSGTSKQGATKITEFHCEKVTSIGEGAFKLTNLKKAFFPLATTVKQKQFEGTSVETVILPLLTSGISYGFFTCSSLVELYMPACLSLSNAITGATSLEHLIMEGATTVGQKLVSSTSLLIADFPISTAVQPTAFSGCTNFDKFVLRSQTAATLSNINAFNSTCFASGGTGGTLYVPQDLISTYEAATNWSIILAYPDNSIQAIEGSPYEVCVHIAAGYGGTVSGGGHYAKNATVTITATPDTGYQFVKWSDDDTNATRTFTATQNLSVYAIFEEVS